MKKSAKVGAWLFVIAAMVAAVVFVQTLFESHEDEKVEKAFAVPSVDSDIRLTNMDYTEMQEGRPMWRIRAQEAKYYEGEQKTLLTQVALTLFMDDHQEMFLVSEHGLLHTGRKDIELWGNVTARVPQGYEVQCDKVYYDHAAQRIESHSPVRLMGPQVDLHGLQWYYDVASSRVRVEGDVRAVVRGLF
ncbi:LPS export ABC transporter periplasmic protein LptC [Desulfosoma caldarium]|uniref:LPS export ABC transporter protein LptC n=1 Tax=Desulfosoma caldarium TaxID=610254 RepID=A0A3N1UIC4_9BACT|nr:LPS export ABC transporter periplasmic protein LptC [Desulfosoma caldarium]ROQ91015.1 LPS export ABC transporter protein LptC [Desulfosoma caldarium]